MFFEELSYDEWNMVAELVADEPAVRLNRRGRRRIEPRVIANAVLWILTTGEPWSRLPARYPSGPTCRGRFEEWKLNGTLAEMIRLLSRTGRQFSFIPKPASAAARPASGAVSRRHAGDGPGGVVWRSAGAWQSSKGATNGSAAADPFAEISRQLQGQRVDAPLGVESRATAVAWPLAQAFRTRSMRGGPSSYSSQITDRRGYVIHAAAEPVPGAMFRAWAEIVKDGKRVERSGLVGPRFADVESAQRHALNWARRWIDRHCPLSATATATDSTAREPDADAAPSEQILSLNLS
ncbi:transposase [Paraburkholderia lacunae]|uniref:Transposase n=1 Tax=Paraburkholderia lacunae TaxID=2211104 RepID=A0A370N0K0_9BURK|nr:DUF6566 family protein [Paraburkholderia lacunae]RDJ99084.1 transposase [Paraburkholderia lacunae]